MIRSWLAAMLIGLAICPAEAGAQSSRQYDAAREKMVRDEIIAAGIKNERVLDSVRKTPRHEFMLPKDRKKAYFDMAVAIGAGQTISPPFVVSFMTEALDAQPDDIVLEIGTGSGYQAAILSPLVKEVYSIEIVESLGKRAAETLKRLKYDNVHCLIGDGYKGWPEHAPFDKIIVTCSPEDVPQPLVDQLKEGGRMVIPLGERYQQALYLFKKEEGKLVKEALLPTMFVPMTGAAEEGRQVLPDPSNPQLANGGFEEEGPNAERPAVWYYQRQARLVTGPDAPEGQRYLVFANTDPGRDARALQAFPIDGRKVRKLNVSVRVLGKSIRRGQKEYDLPAVAIAYYDQTRKALDKSSVLALPQGTYSRWETHDMTFDIPIDAREAILRVGLLGATGELWVDEVEIHAEEKR
ncbi:MAG: protein-L-isoaspartate(D-aspartate) O-methyltransferase [Pirellulales bacterium]